MASPFLESVRADMRLRGYSIRTEKTYLYWIRRYICFCKKQHPDECGKGEVKAFLTCLANERNVAVNTQKMALNTVIYLYYKFLNIESAELGFTNFTDKNKLIIQLLYD